MWWRWWWVKEKGVAGFCGERRQRDKEAKRWGKLTVETGRKGLLKIDQMVAPVRVVQLGNFFVAPPGVMQSRTCVGSPFFSLAMLVPKILLLTIIFWKKKKKKLRPSTSLLCLAIFLQYIYKESWSSSNIFID